MIKFISFDIEPIGIFKRLFENSLKNCQLNPDAMCISSIDIKKDMPHSRFVNLKYIKDNELIFFSNYKSKKGRQFNSCSNVSCAFFWPTINVQVRIEGTIKKTSSLISDQHFENRSLKKNALAISSNQSSIAKSYDDIKIKFQNELENGNLKKRPSYWGGYSISPSCFEFWRGEKNRLNKREEYRNNGKKWVYSILEP